MCALKKIQTLRKIRHISNPSAIGKDSGRSLNIVQKAPGNLMNNSLWPLQAFVLYPFPYSSDISSAYRRLKVDPSQVAFQLLVLFDFQKQDWDQHPVVTEQLGLPFGGPASRYVVGVGHGGCSRAGHHTAS